MRSRSYRSPVTALDDPTLRLLPRGTLELPLESQRCGYFDALEARFESYLTWSLQPDAYHALMDRNFRRSGRVVYRPRCDGCALCQQIRIPAAEFVPTHSQRRVLRRNADVAMRLGPPALSPAKVALYGRYLAARHPGGTQKGGAEELRRFLYDSCVPGLEVEYRDPDGRLLAVSILDVAPRALSSVYCFFEPEVPRRSLGAFSVLAEIDLCRRLGIDWYYLGYYIEGCATMEYKARYLPHERLIGGRWERRS